MQLVNKCPITLEDVYAASRRLGCDQDKFETDQYMCLPNAQMSSLVEFCYNGIMGIKEKGNCLQVNTTDGKVSTKNCTDFAHGCPQKYFWNNEFYMFPDCQNINREYNCYVAQPKCPPVSDDRDNPQIDTTFAVVVTIGVIILCIALCTMAWCIWSRKRKKQETTAEILEEKEEFLNNQDFRSNMEDSHSASNNLSYTYLVSHSEDDMKTPTYLPTSGDSELRRRIGDQTKCVNHSERNFFFESISKMDGPDERTLMSKTYPQCAYNAERKESVDRKSKCANNAEKKDSMDRKPNMDSADERTLMSKSYPPFKRQGQI